jgi:hypothetical protein
MDHKLVEIIIQLEQKSQIIFWMMSEYILLSVPLEK